MNIGAARAALGAALLLSTIAGAASASQLGVWKATGSNRTRVEHFDFFEPGNVAVGRDNDYTYVGNLLRVAFARKGPERDALIELSMPALLGLPDDAVALGAKGQLGLGGTYRASNGEREAALFVKQAWILFHDFHDEHLALKAGRMEFIEGQEFLSGDPVIDWLKRERIAHRLIGNFGFTHVQRSFDGGLVTHQEGRRQAALFAGMPTMGTFDLDGMETLDDVFVGYGAMTWKGDAKHADLRLFAIPYDDQRDGVVKTDNRALAVRRADIGPVQMWSFGGHALRHVGNWDLLAWGVVQTGDWGALDQDSWAYSLEAGHQWPKAGWKPWLRVGIDRTSGDSNPNDNDHETFFPVLPTVRIYARFPFFNWINLTDSFVSLMLKPDPKVGLRFEAHDLDLTERADLWYLGGGAFDRRMFGYVGRPSGGFRSLGTLYDASLDYAATKTLSLTLYHAYVDGGPVVRNTFPDGPDATFTYLEATKKF